jgi:hypothetical protein
LYFDLDIEYKADIILTGYYKGVLGVAKDSAGLLRIMDISKTVAALHNPRSNCLFWYASVQVFFFPAISGFSLCFLANAEAVVL